VGPSLMRIDPGAFTQEKDTVSSLEHQRLLRHDIATGEESENSASVCPGRVGKKSLMEEGGVGKSSSGRAAKRWPKL